MDWLIKTLFLKKAGFFIADETRKYLGALLSLEGKNDRQYIRLDTTPFQSTPEGV